MIWLTMEMDSVSQMPDRICPSGRMTESTRMFQLY